MKRKAMALVAALGMCLVLAACGDVMSSPENSFSGGETDVKVSSQSLETPSAASSSEEMTGVSVSSVTSVPVSVLVAQSLDAEDCMPQRSVRSFQDIVTFFGRRFPFYSKTARRTDLTQADRLCVLEYVDLLIDEFDYEIVGSYSFDRSAEDPFGGYFLDGEWEVCLALTTVDAGRELEGERADVNCDLQLYCDEGELTLWFSDLLHTEDFGHRWSGHTGDRFLEITGERALDAYRLEDGRYRNESDGALSVASGVRNTHHGDTALVEGVVSVRINGQNHSGIAYLWHNTEYDDYIIYLDEFFKDTFDEEITLYLSDQVKGGEVYRLADGMGTRGCSPIIFSCCFNGDTTAASINPPTARAGINACTVRVLQWDHSGEDDCVLYASAELTYELESVSVELLFSAPVNSDETKKKLKGSSAFKQSEAVMLKVGETLELEFDGPYVFMPNYETYHWTVQSGSGVSIKESGDSCTVTAVSPGQVIIKCFYTYGKDQPDVLTGVMHNENHTDSEYYYINVVE